MENEGWYSDLGNKDELHSLRGSDKDVPEHPNWIEEMMWDEYELYIGLQYPTRKIFKNVLRDWAVRKGWDLKFEKK